MIRLNQLHMVLAHFYARIESGQPLSVAYEEGKHIKGTSLEKDRIYKKVINGMASGKTFSASISEVKGIPKFIGKMIDRGEKTGNLAAALKTIINHSSIFDTYTYHMKKIVSYVLTILIFLLALLIYYATLFTDVQSTITKGFPIDVPKHYQLFQILSQDQFLAAVGAVGTILIILFFKTDLIGMIIRHTPYINKNYYRILSLELGTTLDHALSVDTPIDDAILSASESIRDKSLKRMMIQCVSKSKGGTSISRALLSEPLLRNMDMVNTLLLGEKSGNLKDMIMEMNALLHRYLSDNLDREMQIFFRWCVAFCGLLVGIGLSYIFSAIIFTYSLI